MLNTDSFGRTPAHIAAPQPGSRNRRWPRVLLLIAGGLLTLLLLAACVGVLGLRSAARAALPALDGDQRVAALTACLTLMRLPRTTSLWPRAT
jgi:hypothetical protein